VRWERNGVEGSARYDDRPVDEHERARTTMKKTSQRAKKATRPPRNIQANDYRRTRGRCPAHTTIFSLSLSLSRYGDVKVTEASKRPAKLIGRFFGDSNLHLEIHART